MHIFAGASCGGGAAENNNYLFLKGVGNTDMTQKYLSIT